MKIDASEWHAAARRAQRLMAFRFDVGSWAVVLGLIVFTSSDAIASTAPGEASPVRISRTPAVRAATVSGSAPIISAPTTVIGSEGSIVAFGVGASDLDGDPLETLTADLGVLPTGHNAAFSASMQNTQGTFTWTPTFSDSGTYNVSFNATAGGLSGGAVTQIRIQDTLPGLTTEPDPEALLIQTPIPLSIRAKREPALGGTLSGTIIQRSTQTRSYYLYPGACLERASGSWAPVSTPIADSLDSYDVWSVGGYSTVDRTAVGSLWHITNLSVPSSQRPQQIINGSYSWWCGTYGSNWGVGYLNNTFSVLHIDTGSHASDYNLTLTMDLSVETGFDFVYLIGGGGGPLAVDPLTDPPPEYLGCFVSA